MRKLFKISLLIYCIAFLAQSSSAQFLRYKKLSLKDGLPHKTVFRVMQQDVTGMMWFGTEYGLCRYDGYEFVNFTFQDSVSLNSVLSVIELNRDSLLVSFYREGVFIFSHGKLIPIQAKNESGDKIVQLIKGANNTIYAYEVGVGIYEYKDAALKKIKISNVNITPSNIGFAPHLGLLVGTKKGLYIKSEVGLEKYLSEQLANRRIDFIWTDNDNTVWIASNEKVFKLKNNKVTIEWDSIGYCQHSLLYVDYRGFIWRASTDQGLLVKTDQGVKNFNSVLGIKNEIINCIEEDWEGNLWIGTRSNGAFCISMPEYTKTFEDSVHEKLPYASAVLSQKNTHWAASQGKLFKIQNSQIEPIKSNYLKNINTIYNLFEDTNGRVLAATPIGVFVYDDKRKEDYFIKNSYSGATDFCYTKNNQLLVSTYTGVRFLTEDNTLAKYTIDGIDERINTLITDKKGDLWLGAEKSLFKVINSKAHTIKKNIKVFDLLLDYEGNLWVATNRGVIKFDEAGKEHVFTTKNGLMHNLCSALEIDNKGRVWVATLNGLNYYVESKNSFFPFDIQPFEEMDEILAVSIFDENLLLGTVDNVFEIKLEIPTCNPGIVISKLVTDDSIYYTPTSLQLPYQNNSLSVYYSSVAVAYSQQLRYETQLIPVDTGWNTTTYRSINYKNLPPGNYTFSVRVKNHSNGEVSRIESFKFSVHTPFWQKWWFIAIVGLSLFFIALLIHKKRLERIRLRDKKKSEMEKQLLYLKMQAMNALMNPHFISNVLQSIIGYLEQLKPGEDINDKYITYFSELIRLNLINSDKSYISLKDELRRIELYILLEQFRFKNKFEYTIDVDATVDKENIEIPNMVVQPFVENAINHGLLPAKGKGILNITIQPVNNDTIEIVIVDNGVGFNTSQKLKTKIPHRSMGIELVKERLEAAKQTHPITIEDIVTSTEEKSGTKVSVVLEV